MDPDYKEYEEKQEKEWWERFFNIANPMARQVGIRLSLTSTRTHYAVKDYLAVMKSMIREEHAKVKASLKNSVTEVIEGMKEGIAPSIIWNWKLVKPFEVKALFFLSCIAQELKQKSKSRVKM